MSLCTCTCIFVYVYLCIYVFMYVHVFVNVYIYICMYSKVCKPNREPRTEPHQPETSMETHEQPTEPNRNLNDL